MACQFCGKKSCNEECGAYNLAHRWLERLRWKRYREEDRRDIDD